MRRLAAVFLGSLVVALDPAAGPVEAAPDLRFTEFTEGISGSPGSITLGPDGNLWFTEFVAGVVGKITPDGVVTEYTDGLPDGAHPDGIVAGPDGALWFTISASVVPPDPPCDPTGSDSIGRITTDGDITIFSAGLDPQAKPSGITVGPDGALWFAESGYLCGLMTVGGNKIGRITTDGTITEFGSGFSPSSGPAGIALGSDGRLWVTQLYSETIAAMTTTGTVTEYPLPDAQFGSEITAGPDGNLWFTMGRTNGSFGRSTTAGVIDVFSDGLVSDAIPQGITTGPDGKIWAVDNNHPFLYELTLEGVITQIDSGFTGADFNDISTGPPGPPFTLWFTGATGEDDIVGRATFPVNVVPQPSNPPQPVPIEPTFTG